MLRFFAGLVIGIFIGGGGTWAVTSQDVIATGKTALDYSKTIVQVLDQHVDMNTRNNILEDLGLSLEK